MKALSMMCFRAAKCLIIRTSETRRGQARVLGCVDLSEVAATVAAAGVKLLLAASLFLPLLLLTRVASCGCGG